MNTELQLSDVLSEFARTMLTDFPIQGILDHLVLRIVEVLPITAAGVTLISPSLHPRYIAASDASALRYEKLQTELGEGPCLAAYGTGEAVSVPNLGSDERFPTFGPRAVEAGLAAVFTFPLRDGSTQLGALDLYRNTAGSLDASALAAAQTLADVAAAYLLNAQARADLEDSSDRARESSLHDALTGLPNRVLLLERLEHAMLRGSRSGRMAAVLFADLDQFKHVNDTHGHRVGDELLVAVARRLSGLLRPGDTLARLSGDEFVVLCEDLAEAQEAEVIAARIGAALAKRFELSGIAVQVTASIGIAFAGRAAAIPEELLHDADLAMYQAKRHGGARHQIIDLGEQHMAEQLVTLQRDLHAALTAGQLRMEYQPIVAMHGGRVVGVEALLRWVHPSRGLVSPALLVPLAERSGDIVDIGRWVLEQACTDRSRWGAGAPAGVLGMTVNVSTYQLMAPDFAASVEQILSLTGTDPAELTLDLTETALVQDTERALVVLQDLKNLGVRLALDDAGSGDSSLRSMTRFPLDIVKIGQGLVADLEKDASSRAIVCAVVALAHELTLTVIAKGVETAGQRDQMAALGCDACQGFYFARPMPSAHLNDLMTGGETGDGPLLPELVASS